VDTDVKMEEKLQGVPLSSLVTWAQEAPFYRRFPQLRIIERLKETGDVQAVSLFPEDLVVKFGCDPSLNTRIYLWHGDITTLMVDAIVNAAHVGLVGGGGVDGLIHLRAGEQLLEECQALGNCEIGEAKITQGYNLPAKKIIHTVGPTTCDPELLQKAYLSSLKLASSQSVHSIAFPCISTGGHGFPAVEACHVALKTVRQWLMSLEAQLSQLDRIVFCVYTLKNEAVYQTLLPAYFPTE